MKFRIMISNDGIYRIQKLKHFLFIPFWSVYKSSVDGWVIPYYFISLARAESFVKEKLNKKHKTIWSIVKEMSNE